MERGFFALQPEQRRRVAVPTLRYFDRSPGSSRLIASTIGYGDAQRHRCDFSPHEHSSTLTTTVLHLSLQQLELLGFHHATKIHLSGKTTDPSASFALVLGTFLAVAAKDGIPGQAFLMTAIRIVDSIRKPLFWMTIFRTLHLAVNLNTLNRTTRTSSPRETSLATRRHLRVARHAPLNATALRHRPNVVILPETDKCNSLRWC
ncbi:hypothetical protein HPB51_027734 [Rhipicephalus microplus]|uniref:Uncharacterized protein n=1 Tax=Rhipicephalus microplus TaxID=6941 RepID=A0A9J6CZI9_RHIMP|nr:hypothetical protein HPB51_027734 [Rhipicephalus microplus]